MNIGIMFGGSSVEHEISILSTYQIKDGFKNNKVYLLYLNKENEMFLLNGETKVEEFKNIPQLEKMSKKVQFKKKGITGIKIDVMLIMIHGAFGEDGRVSSLLDYYEIPYIGPDSRSFIAHDKEMMKILLKSYDIKSIPFFVLHDDEAINLKELNKPVIIKPCSLGSSIGIEVVRSISDMKEKLNKAFLYDSKVLIEDYYENIKEINCAVMKTKNDYLVSKVESMEPKHEILTYEDKYKDKLKKKEFIAGSLAKEAQDIALAVYKLFNLSGVARIDFIHSNDELYVSEINIIPGSLAYYLFDHSLERHLDLLIIDALFRSQKLKGIDNHLNENILNLTAKK